MEESPQEPIFVVQRHDATALHFDLRLQVGAGEGAVLASWAVPKGPSLDPSVKRLARQVGDHAMSHASFEGHLDGGNGKSTVVVWDTGVLVNLTERDGRRVELDEAIERGHLKVELHGHKLAGGFALTRTAMNGDRSNWLLVKVADAAADPARDPARDEPESVLTGRVNEDYEV